METIYPTNNNTQRIQSAIDTVTGNGGGTVQLLPGIHCSGTLHLKSGLNLEILPGATLKAIEDPDAFEALQSSVISRMDVQPWKAFIHSDSESNISISGGGTIDGSGDTK